MQGGAGAGVLEGQPGPVWLERREERRAGRGPRTVWWGNRALSLPCRAVVGPGETLVCGGDGVGGPLSQNPSPALSSPWPPSPRLPHPGPSRALPTLPRPPLPPGLGLPPPSHGGLDFGHAGMRPPLCLSRLLLRGPAGTHVGRGAFHPPSSLPSLGLLPCGAVSEPSLRPVSSHCNASLPPATCPGLSVPILTLGLTVEPA